MGTRSGILVLCFLMVGCTAQNLPSTKVTDVKEIIARLDEDDDPNWRGKPFVVAPQDHEAILALFRNGTVDSSPMKRYPLGRIEIDYKDGHQTGIALFWTGATKGAYKIGNKYYRGGSDGQFMSTLKACRANASEP